VGDYRLSVRARADLIDIYEFTDALFGRYQADAYHSGFERTFSLLAEFPGIGISADELVSGYRRFRFQSHYIFYTQEGDSVLIRVLVHIRQNLRAGLFE
jgi:toxin ParE1/3/4